MITVLGNRDYILRIFPLLGGLATIPLIYLLARRFRGGLVALLPLTLVALNPNLIYFSSEVKQFGIDALAATILLLLGMACLQDEPKPASWIGLGAAGILSTWISHPAVFVLAGVGLTLAGSCLLRRQWKKLPWLIGVGVVFALNLALQYSSTLHRTAQNQFLSGYWSWSFAPGFSAGAFSWYEGTLNEMLQNPAALPVGIIAVALCLAGIASLAIRRWEHLALVLLPVVMGLVASGLKLYPFTGRFLIFAVPSVVIAAAAGVDWISGGLARLSRPAGSVLAVVMAGFLVYQPLVTAYQTVKSPPLRDHIRPAMAFLSQHYQQSDVIYVYYYAVVQYEYYAPFYGLGERPYVQGVEARQDPPQYIADIDKLVGNRRVWFVFSHDYRSGKMDEWKYFLNHLDSIGVRLSEFYAPGVSVYLYDLSSPPSG